MDTWYPSIPFLDSLNLPTTFPCEFGKPQPKALHSTVALHGANQHIRGSETGSVSTWMMIESMDTTVVIFDFLMIFSDSCMYFFWGVWGGGGWYIPALSFVAYIASLATSSLPPTNRSRLPHRLHLPCPKQPTWLQPRHLDKEATWTKN